ncbi:MAG: aminotransferase class V-fold PLP-dependent enzyme [Eubacteriaceae bacterium]|jgi:cysteine desulfurase family protein
MSSQHRPAGSLSKEINTRFPGGIYLDNSASSSPKAPGCAETVFQTLSGTTANINRGSYSAENTAGMKIYQTRELIRRFFDAPVDCMPVFMVNITNALSTVIRGFLNPGDHVIISGLEHHAVTRALTGLGVDYSVIPSCPDGSADPAQFEKLICPRTKAVILNHASNVSGTVNPVGEIFETAGKYNLLRVLDTAQSAGTIPVSMTALHVDVLCFTGHKGLLGPQGTGGMILSQETADRIRPLICGGTGSISAEYTMPDFLPDKFEAGTLNIPGILGLGAAVDWLNSQDLQGIRSREQGFAQRFADRISEIPGISVAGGKDYSTTRCPVVSAVFEKESGTPQDTAARLDQEYGIMLRAGLHCAPLAHQTLGTLPEGTLRFSFGPFSMEEEADAAAAALEEIVSENRKQKDLAK